jgi:hypothetical protein
MIPIQTSAGTLAFILTKQGASQQALMMPTVRAAVGFGHEKAGTLLMFLL